MCLVGDSETAAAHPFLHRLLEYFAEHGDVRSAAEYGEDAAAGAPRAPRPPSAAERAAAAERAREAALEARLRQRLVAFASDETAREMLLPRRPGPPPDLAAAFRVTSA